MFREAIAYGTTNVYTINPMSISHRQAQILTHLSTPWSASGVPGSLADRIEICSGEDLRKSPIYSTLIIRTPMMFVASPQVALSALQVLLRRVFIVIFCTC